MYFRDFFSKVFFFKTISLYQGIGSDFSNVKITKTRILFPNYTLNEFKFKLFESVK